MTQIQHVTAKEMTRRTGFKNALGYSFPEKDLILVRKGLKGKQKQNVLQHEEEHIKKGEEGPFLGGGSFLGGALSLGGSLLGGSARSKSDKRALEAQERQSAQTREDLAPYRSFGLRALPGYENQPYFRFKQPGYGTSSASRGTSQQTTQRPQLTASQIRQNLIGSGQFAGGGGVVSDPSVGIFLDVPGLDSSHTNTRLQAEKLRDYVVRGWDAWKAKHGEGTIQEFINHESFGKGGPDSGWEADVRIGYGGGGLDEDALQAEINRQLAAQSAQSSSDASDSQYGPDFRTDPAYQFRLNEGMRALENSAIARGGLLSGNSLRAGTEYAQNVAADEYAKIYDREYKRQLDEYLTEYQRRKGDVDLGYSAAAGGAQLGLSSANQISNILQNSGANRANSINNAFAGVAGAVGDYYGNKRFNDFLDRAYPV